MYGQSDTIMEMTVLVGQLIHKRPFTGMKRKSVGKRVRDIGVSVHHYKEMGATPEQKITAGNLTQSQLKMVLWKLESEMRQAERHNVSRETAAINHIVWPQCTSVATRKNTRDRRQKRQCPFCPYHSIRLDKHLKR